MVPPCSHRIPRVRRYSGIFRILSSFRVRGCHTLWRIVPYPSAKMKRYPVEVRTPRRLLPAVWPVPRSLATTDGISVDFSSSPYLDVSVQAVPYIYLCIQYMLTDLHLPGCPIRKSPDIAPAYGSPWLFAVNHVLLRLPVPRHSPCALCSLTSFYVTIYTHKN